MSREVRIGPMVTVGGGRRLALIAGPCVAESRDLCLRVAERLANLGRTLEVGVVFKASYDKANRTSGRSFRGPGEEEGLQILADVRRETGLPVLSDVHDPAQAPAAAQVLDCLQIPAFLCRQTDLLLAAAAAGKPINIKKGQFLAPWDIRHAVDKVADAGNQQVLLTERGATFGYGNLVVDFRSLPIMGETGCPIVFDVTHSLQLPGAAGDRTGGQREFAAHLLRAACAVGVDALFLETHPEPDRALSDATTTLPLDSLEALLRPGLAIDRIVKGLG